MSKIDEQTNDMQCPNCSKKGCKYLSGTQERGFYYDKDKRITLNPRKDFRAKCNKCGWRGELKYRSGLLKKRIIF